MNIENRHHISYPRREHTTDLQRAYRHFGLMVVHMEVKPHNELHATVPPMPRLPSKPILESAWKKWAQVKTRYLICILKQATL